MFQRNCAAFCELEIGVYLFAPLCYLSCNSLPAVDEQRFARLARLQSGTHAMSETPVPHRGPQNRTADNTNTLTGRSQASDNTIREEREASRQIDKPGCRTGIGSKSDSSIHQLRQYQRPSGRQPASSKKQSYIYASSIASDTPWPTPTHIVASARFAPVFCN